jgi:hypothetical protein
MTQEITDVQPPTRWAARASSSLSGLRPERDERFRPPFYREWVSARPRPTAPPESVYPSGIPAKRMERLWSLAVATGGNRWQMHEPRDRLEQAKTVATGCDQLPIGW